VYEPVEDGVNVQDELVAPETAALFRYHWYVYDGVPPVTVDVKVLDWPTSSVADDGDIETESAVFTVTDAVFDFTLTPALSVTFTYTL